MIKITHQIPAIVLAPMEGVTDAPMRSLLTEQGGFSYCVSEFLRVAQEVPPAKVYQKHIPELDYQWQTLAKTPVQIQLLGGDPERLSRAALLACELGASGIDLNFGCPAPTVNRSDGGATLLKYPQRIRAIVKCVRDHVPAHIPVSAKLRLGWDDSQSIFENAQMVVEGGADWMTIHARTRFQGYAPPVDWMRIGEVKKMVPIPVVANGDIWTFEDFLRCRDLTECEHFMLGRGAVVNPYLARRIAKELQINTASSDDNENEKNIPWKNLINRFVEIALAGGQTGVLKSPLVLCGRLKQWGKMASMRSEITWYDEIKRLENLDEIRATINRLV